MAPTIPASGTARASLPAEKQKKKPYPLYLGGIAASLAGAVTHPLDVAKVRLQVSGDKSMFGAFKNILSNYGVRGLYDGLTGTLLRQLTYSTLRFAVYQKTLAYAHTEAGPAPVWKLAAAGSLAGALSGGLCNPAELAMVRMQADRGKPVEQRYNYRNAVQALVRMTREEGVGRLYSGWAPNTGRALMMNAGQLGGYDLFKGLILSNGLMKDGTATHFTSGFCAATLAILLCNPFDCVKSRVMSDKSNAGVMNVIRTSIAKEGMLFFYKGALPAWIRLQPTTILTFLALENLRVGVDKMRETGITWV